MGSHLRADWETNDSVMPQVTDRLERIGQAQKQAHNAMTRAQQMWVKCENVPQYRVGEKVWLDGRNLQTDRPMIKLAA